MEFAISILRQAMYLALLLVAPVVLVSLLVGLVVGFVQAATQIQEQTVAFVPRLIAVAIVLFALGPWMGGQLVRFTQAILEGFPRAIP